LRDIEFDGDGPTPAGASALETAAWAAKRLNLGIGVGSARRARAETIRDALARAGVQAQIVGGGPSGGVELQWLTPGRTEP
jgi:hypothetical protein